MIRVNVVIQNKISLRNIKNPQKYLSKRKSFKNKCFKATESGLL